MIINECTKDWERLNLVQFAYGSLVLATDPAALETMLAFKMFKTNSKIIISHCM